MLVYHCYFNFTIVYSYCIDRPETLQSTRCKHIVIWWNTLVVFGNFFSCGTDWPTGIRNLAFTWKLPLISEISNPFSLLHLKYSTTKRLLIVVGSEFSKASYSPEPGSFKGDRYHLDSRNCLRILLTGDDLQLPAYRQNSDFETFLSSRIFCYDLLHRGCTLYNDIYCGCVLY